MGPGWGSATRNWLVFGFSNLKLGGNGLRNPMRAKQCDLIGDWRLSMMDLRGHVSRDWIIAGLSRDYHTPLFTRSLGVFPPNASIFLQFFTRASHGILPLITSDRSKRRDGIGSLKKRPFANIICFFTASNHDYKLN